jgi:hypothetical protein
MEDFVGCDEGFEPSCPIAQQLIGSLFGFICGFIVHLILKFSVIVLFSIALGSSFGILGSRISNPFNIEQSKWISLCLLCFLISLPFSSLLYFDMIGIFFLSLIVSMLSTHLQFWYDVILRERKTKQSSKSFFYSSVDARV